MKCMSTGELLGKSFTIYFATERLYPKLIFDTASKLGYICPDDSRYESTYLLLAKQHYYHWIRTNGLRHLGMEIEKG